MIVQNSRFRDNGKENGDYYSALGLYRDNGKGSGNSCLGFRALRFTLWGAWQARAAGEIIAPKPRKTNLKLFFGGNYEIQMEIS